MLLCLFDINGTLLLGSNSDHLRVLREAAERVWHCSLDETSFCYDVEGRTDRMIVRRALDRAGVPEQEIRKHLPAWEQAAGTLFAEVDDRPQVAPAAAETLSALAKRGHRLALLTGNLEEIARRRMQAAGLSEFFPQGQGGFGSDHELRRMLVQIARERAGGGGAWWPRERTVVIGDTPRDIGAAHCDSVAAVAVATGSYDAAALSGAEQTFETLARAGAYLAGLG